MQKPVKYYNKKLSIMGTLHLPETKENFDGVILLHGFTGTKIEPHRFFWKISKKLEENGIASIRFDYRGCGESEGDSENFTIKDYISDAKKIFKKFLKIKGINSNSIGVIGLSMGGIVACYLASIFDNIKKLVLISAVAHPKESFFDGPKKNYPEFLQQYKSGIVDFGGNIFSKKFFDIAKRLNPVEKIKNFNGKALLIYGDKDELVSLEHMKSYKEAIKNCEVYIVKDGDHTFNNFQKEKEVISKILEFFKNGG